MGDIVHAIPFAAALRAAMPSAEIDWAVDPRYVPLLNLVPVVSRAIPLATKGSAARRRLASAIRDLRASRYDVVFDLQGLVKSAVIARAAGGRETVGFARRHLREPAAGLLYTRREEPRGATHVIQKNLTLLAAVGLRDLTVRFPLTVPASAAADAVRERLGAGPERRFVAINPGAAWPNKQWPAASFGAVAAALHASRGLRTAVLWGPGERALADAVGAASAGAAEAAPPTDVGDVVAIARAASLFISGDTGPLHLAVAVSAPIVALFGPSLPERNGPIAADDLVLSRADACQCLYERRCRLTHPCLFDIRVHEVVDAAERRLTAELRA